ncbi:MAG: glycosyltransferase family 2 protein [Clostridia bacterium]|nr:glycosyltransferase family 2 protein [Clostridia bacterium]
MKLITFAVPCYNSAAYMEHCIDTLLHGGEEVEIVIVNDGSKDETGAIADRYQEKYPTIVRAVHQENGGHGEGVNQGLRNATGLYYKVVDSDDWLDTDALDKLLAQLRIFARMENPVDLVIANYVYEHVEDNTQKVMRLDNVLPQNRIFTWDDVGHFRVSQFILMHTAVYRTQVLRDSGMVLPKHTFYVDNVFVYVPLPWVKTLYYMDIDLYRYFIGRADQSVTEANIIRRIDQQIRVARINIAAHDLKEIRKQNKRLAAYMYHFSAMLIMICQVYLLISGTEEHLALSRQLWKELKAYDAALYRRMRYFSSNIVFILPRRIVIPIYRLIRRIYKFN